MAAENCPFVRGALTLAEPCQFHLARRYLHDQLPGRNALPSRHFFPGGHFVDTNGTDHKDFTVAAPPPNEYSPRARPWWR